MTTVSLPAKPPFQFPALPVRFPRRDIRAALASALRVAVVAVAGGLPVLSISAHVFGFIDMATAARYVDLPVIAIAIGLMLQRPTEGAWAARGVVAGLVATTAYDALRLPCAITHVWPDPFGHVGGWVVHGNAVENLAVGYLWRYVGDGGGIAVVFFLAAALFRLRTHIIWWAVGYGVLVWSGLVATVVLSAEGQHLLFHVTPATLGVTLAGHLIYGATMGAGYHYAVATFGAPVDSTKNVAARHVALAS